jgi:deoxyribonucleoside regulator
MLWIKNGRWKTMKEYDSLSDNEKRNMLASVANLYYNAEMTQNQIAERFFTSRSKISRMLKEARQLGIEDIKNTENVICVAVLELCK